MALSKKKKKSRTKNSSNKAIKYRGKAQISIIKRELLSSMWIKNHLPGADVCITPAGISTQIAASFTR